MTGAASRALESGLAALVTPACCRVRIRIVASLSGDNLVPMEAGPGRELCAVGGLWGPPARALRDEVGAEVQQRSQRPTGQRGCRLVPIRGTQCWQWLWQLCGSVFVSPRPPSPRGRRRRQPRGDKIHSLANLIDANRPRGLTRDSTRPSTVSATDVQECNIRATAGVRGGEPRGRAVAAGAGRRGTAFAAPWVGRVVRPWLSHPRVPNRRP
jgi:hypothetical protein